MNIKNIEKRVSGVKIPTSFDFEFLYDVLLAYGKPQPSITRLKKGTYNLAEDKTHEVYWKNVVLFRYVAHHDLHITIDDLKRSPYGQKHTPRFIIITDLDQLLAVDTKTEDTLEIPLKDFAKHYAFFLPWAGMEKSQIITENEADVKAAERMAKLYDEIITIEENATDNPVFYHNLNVFFSRLLFCFFAEDTEVFKQHQFTHAISDYTQHDGSDLNTFLDELFQALDEKDHDTYPAHIAEFPYVNGGLFHNHMPAPKFNAKARNLIIKCGELNWSEINPDIFGSMIQAVVHPGQRAGLGMHYTSVVNIMKVIEPLFLEELKEELDKADGDEHRLSKLLRRIYAIKVFDPACGSGNFLIISFKELRKIEHKILKQIIELNNRKYAGESNIQLGSGLKLENFYGIEIDDFAREVAVLSLWLAKHQMNIEFKKAFGKDIPLIPLKDMGNITRDNAAQVNWEEACAVAEIDEVYLIGNPPYLGTRNQKPEHRADKELSIKALKNYKNLDYIAIWFYKGHKFIQSHRNAQLAFVSTNSITQGDQVALLWPSLLNDCEISFAHTNFKWTNNAKHNAGVTVVIIALRRRSNKPRKLYEGLIAKTCANINAYLAAAADVYVGRRSNPLSGMPEMIYGNEPREKGNLLLEKIEHDELIASNPGAEKYIKKVTGSNEYINDLPRWCIWVDEQGYKETMNIPFFKDRYQKVADYRLTSDRVDTQKYASQPYKFTSITYQQAQAILIPIVFSERREYISAGYVNKSTVILNSAQVVYGADPYVLGIISSKLHMTWVRAVAGQLETRIRYSSVIAYNNFPVPQFTEDQKRMINNNVLEILDVREKYPEFTLAELYDPDKMPTDLRRAHADLDEVIERCYRVRPFDDDEDRLSHLFRLYEIMTGVQKELLNA